MFYAFTNEWERPAFDPNNGDIIKPAKIGDRTDKKEYTLAVGRWVFFDEHSTSKTNGKEMVETDEEHLACLLPITIVIIDQLILYPHDWVFLALLLNENFDYTSWDPS